GRRPGRARLERLFLEPAGAAVGVELDHAVALGITHPVREHRRAAHARCRALDRVGEAVTVEHVVAERQRHTARADERAADEKGLGEPVGTRLHRVIDRETEVTTVAEEATERLRVVRRRDHENLADAGEHQRRQRVVHHRLVVDRDPPPVVIDVRDPDEYRDGHIEAASNISRGFLEFRIGGAVSDPSTPIVLYCQTGLRSVLAAKQLKELGYQNVINLAGGYQKWVQSGLPVVKDVALTPDQLQRYSRHFLLPQVGDKGQRRLLRSRVLLI